MARVSINICCYNSEKYLAETLESVLAQTYSDWELILLDDGSTDSTRAIIEAFQTKQVNPQKIQYHYQKNQGLGAARNKAISLSSGEFIAFLDHDDLWLPTKLEKQIPFFDRYPRAGIVHSNTVYFNSRGDEKLMLRDSPMSGEVFRELLGAYFISLETAVIRRVSLEKLTEWFDPRFCMIEEAELFLRIAHQWEVHFVPEPLGKWRVHSQSLTHSKQCRFADETLIMLDKFSQLYPGFQTEYREEIRKLQAGAEYLFALEDWKKGSPKVLRRRLRPYLRMRRRYLLPFMLSFILTARNYERIKRIGLNFRGEIEPL